MILTVSSQIWHAFLCARLMQVTRLSDVTKKRALLLYALASGFSVDVGKVIYHSIRHIHRGSTTSGLGHSSLITTLYQHARVEIGLEEEMDGPKSVLNMRLSLVLEGTWTMSVTGTLLVRNTMIRRR